MTAERVVFRDHPLPHQSFLASTAADSEDVAVRMPDMHLPDVPRHIGWGPGDFEALIDAAAMDFVDIIDPDRHPYSLVAFFVTFRTESHFVRAFSTAALSTFA
jgi:hypothetical protein